MRRGKRLGLDCFEEDVQRRGLARRLVDQRQFGSLADRLARLRLLECLERRAMGPFGTGRLATLGAQRLA